MISKPNRLPALAFKTRDADTIEAFGLRLERSVEDGAIEASQPGAGDKPHLKHPAARVLTDFGDDNRGGDRAAIADDKQGHPALHQ